MKPKYRPIPERTNVHLLNGLANACGLLGLPLEAAERQSLLEDYHAIRAEILRRMKENDYEYSTDNT